ncbi:nucleotidyl transferase [Moraxella caviae]|uniref:Glucose-1-phosphate thymidylyltransferase n=1 Tax=Moraxella caviae TaxID=34060 RepID=A0A1T0A5Q5_9GAMM|nr:nucleotidyltransferase family protein [Moraxella caviae]OOR91103.1 nucleotidyl transferase [Moraxella caviae]STZ14199.1 Glucose-1-phosphate thymidylyltransferase [Moraxella caviae]VEW13430.1 Glucose-1-phosphate thymidylyltransferase [Moraxella caviae]
MITQAMILAAGKGTRMRPLTLTTPKPLVPVADKPLIFWHIERLKAAGITDITINAGYLGKVLIDALAAQDFGVNLRISDESVLPEPLETAGGIRHALAQGLLADAPFILVNGDVWSEYDFGRLAHLTLGDNLAHLVLTKNPEHNLAGDFHLTAGRVSEKDDSQSTENHHTFAGISVLNPKIVADVAAGKIAPLAPFLKAAMADGRVAGELMSDLWVDVGTLERLAWVDNYAKSLADKRG